MSTRLDLLIALLAWLGGFAWVHRGGSWAPLGILACVAALRLVVLDRETRSLLVPSTRRVALGVAGGAVMIAATYLLYNILGRVFGELPGATRALYGVLHRDEYRPPVLVSLVLLISAAEEVVWRGRLLSRIPLVSGGLFALAALYGLSHLSSGSLLLAGLAAGCGLCWSAIRIATKSLVPAIVTHALWDLAVLVLWPLA